MNPYDFELNLRMAFIICGSLILLNEVISFFWPLNRIELLANRISDRALTSWKMSLTLLTGVYLSIGLIAKFSALYSDVYAAQDYWIFDDMLYWMVKGSPFVTRFAQQAVGPLQHGAVHPFLTWYLLTPIAALFGATIVATSFNAIVLAGAGYCLGILSYRRTGKRELALILPLAFWFSEWTSRILNYETHPESIYPLLVFLIVSPSLLKPKRNTLLFLSIASWAALAFFKQDTIVIGGLIWCWILITRQANRNLILASITMVICGFVTMTLVAKGFSINLGPSTVMINGSAISVAIPHSGSAVLGGHTITGFSSIISIFSYFISSAGGIEGFALRTFKYFVTAPFVPLILIAPWILIGRSFWILVAPLAFLFSLVGGQAGGLEIYYSVSLICLLWVAIVYSFEDRPKFKWLTSKRKMTWVFCYAALYGGTGPKFYHPSGSTSRLLAETPKTLANLPGIGIVSSALLLTAPRDRIWSDRAVPGHIPDFVSWVAYPENLRTYEDSFDVHLQLQSWFKQQPDWRREISNGLEIYRRVEKF